MYYATTDDGTFVGVDLDPLALAERCMLNLIDGQTIIIKDDDVLCMVITGGYDDSVILCNVAMRRFEYYKPQNDGLLAKIGVQDCLKAS